MAKREVVSIADQHAVYGAEPIMPMNSPLLSGPDGKETIPPMNEVPKDMVSGLPSIGKKRK